MLDSHFAIVETGQHTTQPDAAHVYDGTLSPVMNQTIVTDGLLHGRGKCDV